MKNLNKFGFTLIELMVAIVIMGILVAVGVPKLTGAVSKSKATEVAPAATAYIKLQSAYVMERRQIGTWKRIGYEKPKSSVFEYSKGDITSKKAIADLGEGLVGWEATNKVGLGDCPLGKKWTVTIINSGADDNGNFRLEYKGEVNHSVCATISGDWGVVGGDITVAENEKPKETYKFVGNQMEFAVDDNGYDENGKLTFGKIVVSAKDSQKNSDIMADYGFTGYVEAKAVSTDFKAKLAETVGKDLSNAKVVAYTELYDVPGSEKPGTGIYKGQMNLFYTQQAGRVYATNLYGHKDIYANYLNGVLQNYCLDEACSETIKKENNTIFMDWDDSWIKDDFEVNDPFDQVPDELLASSPLTKNQSKSDNPDITYAIGHHVGFGANQIEGIECCYVGSYSASQNLKTWLASEVPASSGKSVMMTMQIFSNEPEMGHLYASTISLYYGSSNTGYNFYERRKIYAVMKKEGVWNYYSDKEATQIISPDNLSFWQSDMGKME